MCCFFTTLMLLGPRAGILVWWLLSPLRWKLAFQSNIIWPFLGFLFMPWTTLIYVGVSPNGLSVFDWMLIGLAVLSDIGMYAGGGYGNKDRLQTT